MTRQENLTHTFKLQSGRFNLRYHAEKWQNRWK